MQPFANSIRRLSYWSMRHVRIQCPYAVRKKYHPDGIRTTVHRHDFPQIWYCISGRFTLILDQDKPIEITQGQLLVIPSGHDHLFLEDPDCETQLFTADIHSSLFLDCLDTEFLHTRNHLFLQPFLRQEGVFLRPISLCDDSRSAVTEVFSHLAAARICHLQICPRDILTHLETIFSLPELAASQAAFGSLVSLWQSKLLPILSCMNYINLNYADKILVEDLLHMAAIGHTAFFTAFRNICGCTFAAYLQHVRLIHCHCLMADTDFSLAVISSLCGFSSQSHMERAYKKYSGVLPRHARKHAREWLSQLKELTESKMNTGHNPSGEASS